MDDSLRDETAGRTLATSVSPIQGYLKGLHDALMSENAGHVADYIPELAKADPNAFGVCIATVDGQLYSVGDANTPFTIQSMSKPFSYGYALREYGVSRVLEQVGVEPTGEAFNSIILDEEKNRPFNPMVNAGAIAIADLLPGSSAEDKAERVTDFFSALAGRPLSIDEAVYNSEDATGHRNRAIAYMMLNSGMITHLPEEVLDLYFKQCALLVTCQDMAIMGATLANHGRNPTTGDRIFAADHVRDILTLMSTCGMYDYAGQWAYDVGLPAKSGVAGGVVAVIPGQAAVAVYSPPLDEFGNSIRGIEVCKALSRDFGLHAFSDRTLVQTVIRRENRANALHSKRMRSQIAQRVLQTEGHRIAILEVQGALYFGSCELMIRRMTELAQDCDALVVDFTRVSDADQAAERLLRDMVADFARIPCELSFTGIHDDSPLNELTKALGENAEFRVSFAEDVDLALERLENTLLSGVSEAFDFTSYALSKLDIFQGLGEHHLKALEPAVSSFSFHPGARIISEGDEANAVFVLVKGSATVSVPTDAGGVRRIASIGPGASFGEMALIEGGKRSADVTAEEDVVCYALAVETLREIAQKQPEVLQVILENLVKSLTARLYQANQEIRSLL